MLKAKNEKGLVSYPEVKAPPRPPERKVTNNTSMKKLETAMTGKNSKDDSKLLPVTKSGFVMLRYG